MPPVPKRASQRLGHRTKAEQAQTKVIKASGKVAVPPPAKDWHPMARDWYLSLADSAQSQHFEPSDWQAARLVAVEITRMLTAEYPNANLFGKVWSAMGELMTTEGARRRLKIEVERRPLGAAAPVANMDDYRAL